MYRAIEAVCREGQIVPLEPVRFEENEHLVIVRLPANAPPAVARPSATGDWDSFVGVLKDSPNWNGTELAGRCSPAAARRP